MASIRNKYTKFTNNYNNENNVLSKSCAKFFDPNSSSHTNHINNCNNNIHTNGSRPQLRWSQSFSPTDRQKPNVSTLIRRKSAVERLAETKCNYIKSPTTPNLERDGKEKQRTLLHKSLSTSALKPSLVILRQSPPNFLSNTSVESNSIQVNASNIKTPQSIASSGHQNCSPNGTTNSSQPVTRKRNPSLSSRLSGEGSNYLEQQLRQLIADNEEQNNSESQLTSNRNICKNETKVSVINSESPAKPKPKERLKTTNQQILRQNSSAVPKQRTIFPNNFYKINDKTIVDNKKSVNSILRYNSSHNNNNTINNKFSNNFNSKLIISTKTMTQTLRNSVPTVTISPVRNKSTTGSSSRQSSISRSKSDVSNRLLIRRNKSKDEIERFFETLGLDSSVWDSIRSEATNSMISTPAHYFESCDSLESDVRQCALMSSSSSSTSSDRHSTSAQPKVERQTLNTRLMQSRSCNTLSSGTSIVEKNARVIKWLYNCRKAMVQL